MICEYITRYLLLNKRLVVPNFGAFVVNPSNGDLIFVELLKMDDGVLMRQLMADGLSAVDAMNMIDRFVFEIRHKVESGGVATLNGIGRMSMAEDGLYRFEYDPDAGREIAVPAAMVEAPAPELVTEPEPEVIPEPQPVAEPIVEPIAQPVEEKAEPQPEPEHEPEHESEHEPEHESEPKVDLPKFELSPMDPNSYVKGLRYGKPQRPSKDDIRYVGNTAGRGVDKFVVVAVVAALLAIGAIVYGWLSSRNQDDIYGYEEEFMEQVDVAADEMIEQTDLVE